MRLFPHLQNAPHIASFDPFSLLARLPSRVRDISSEGEVAALLHENTHYIQAISTTFGTYRSLVTWEAVSVMGTLRSQAPGTALTEEQRQELAEAYASSLRKLEAFSQPAWVEVPKGAFPACEGAHHVELPDDRAGYAYAHTLSGGYRTLDLKQEYASCRGYRQAPAALPPRAGPLEELRTG